MARQLLVLGIVCGACAFAGVGMMLLAIPERTASLVVEPSHIDLPRSEYEGESIATHFVLRNQSAQPIRITEIATSCGCMGLTGNGGIPLAPPFEMAGGEARTLELQVATTGRRGTQRFLMTARGTSRSGNALEANGELRATIEYPLIADPPATSRM